MPEERDWNRFSYENYVAYREGLSNPLDQLMHSMATVRAIIRDAYRDNPEVGIQMLSVLDQDMRQLKESLYA